MSASEGGRKPDAAPAALDRAGLSREPARLCRRSRRARRRCCARRWCRRTVPRWLRNQGRGWMTAEYSLLPASTGDRVEREASRGKQQGRTVEIQRLIGRALRAVVDFEALGERTLWLDCDVLQADGGTRCAAICGAYVAAKRALDRFGLSRAFLDSVAAVSVGVVDGVPLLDLDYSEDSNADTDMNVVMTGDGRLDRGAGDGREATRSRARRSTSCSRSRERASARSRELQAEAVARCSSLSLLAIVHTIGWPHVLLRLFVAAALGGAIGLERELRERQAGLRTHLVVCVGSALFTLVSAYGFREFLVTAARSSAPTRRGSRRRSSAASASSARARSSARASPCAGSRPPRRSGSSPRSAWRRAPGYYSAALIATARRAAHARAAPHRRLPDRAAGTAPRSTGCSSRSRRAAARCRARGDRATRRPRRLARDRAGGRPALVGIDVELQRHRGPAQSSPTSARSTACSRCGGPTDTRRSARATRTRRASSRRSCPAGRSSRSTRTTIRRRPARRTTRTRASRRVRSRARGRAGRSARTPASRSLRSAAAPACTRRATRRRVRRRSRSCSASSRASRTGARATCRSSSRSRPTAQSCAAPASLEGRIATSRAARRASATTRSSSPTARSATVGELGDDVEGDALASGARGARATRGCRASGLGA